jgi:hypothetical protein
MEIRRPSKSAARRISSHVKSPRGLLLPALGMILTVVWLARRGLMRLDLWR